MNKALSFLREVRFELGKVTWPKKNEMIGSVVIVCLYSVFFAIVLGSMDAVFHAFVRWIIS